MSSPGTDLMGRPPGRPRNCWLQQINNGSLTGTRQSWRAAEDRGIAGRRYGPPLPMRYDGEIPNAILEWNADAERVS